MTVGYRMAGDAMEDPSMGNAKEIARKERGTVDKYWDDKETNPGSPPPDVDDSFTPSATLGNPSHSQTDTTASDFIKSQMASMSGGGGSSSGSGGSPGVNDGKAWADKWAGGYRNNTSGLESADKYIQYSKGEQVVDREALAKTIDQRPLYHQAKGDVYQSQWGGDMWKYKPPTFNMPDKLAEIKTPDLSGDKYLDMIKDID